MKGNGLLIKEAQQRLFVLSGMGGPKQGAVYEERALTRCESTGKVDLIFPATRSMRNFWYLPSLRHFVIAVWSPMSVWPSPISSGLGFARLMQSLQIFLYEHKATYLQ
jgi:hypothetical protein